MNIIKLKFNSFYNRLKIQNTYGETNFINKRLASV